MRRITQFLAVCLLYALTCHTSAYALDCPFPGWNFSCNSSISFPIEAQLYRPDVQGCNADIVEDFQLGYWLGLPGDGDSWTIGVLGPADSDGAEQFNIYTCSGGNLNCVGASNSNEGFGTFTESFLLNTVNGEMYYVFVNAPTLDAGTFLSAAAFNNDFCPFNYSCDRAVSLVCGETITGNTEVTNFSEAPDAACNNAGDGGNEGLWFEMIGTGNDITATITDSDFDTQLAVYSGSCGFLTCIDGIDVVGAGAEESITFPSYSGSRYSFYVDGWNGQEGEFELEIECEPGCPGSFPIACNSSLSAFLQEQQPRPDLVSCASGISVDGPGYWVSFAGLAESVQVAISSNDFDVLATVFTCSGNTLNCVRAENSNIVYNDFQEIISLPPAPGTDYYVYVSSDDPDDLNKWFGISMYSDFDCPLNSFCSRAIPISCGESITGDITNASTFAPSPTACGVAADGNNPGLYYEFYGDGNDIEVQITNSDFDTQLAVYNYSNCDFLTCVDGVDVVGAGADESITVSTSVGSRHLIYVDGWNNGQGEFDLEISCTETCPENFPLSCNGSLTAFYVLLPDYLAVTACDPDVESTGPGYWVNFTGTGGLQQVGIARFDDTKPNPQINIYRCQGNDLICHAAFDDDNGQSTYDNEFGEFTTVAGEDYYALITYNEQLESGVGEFFGIQFFSDDDCPANRYCEYAKSIQCGETVSGSNSSLFGLTTTADACGIGADGGNPGLYYSIIGDGNDITATISNSNFDSQIAVYSGSNCDFLTCIDGADTPGNGVGESITFPTSVANEYVIYVDGWSNQVGDFDLSIDCPDPCPNPVWTFSCNSTISAPLHELQSIPNAVSCSTGVDTEGMGTWMGLTGTGQEVTVGLIAPADIDLHVNVYRCTGSGLICVGGFDDDKFLGFWNEEVISFPTINGQEYLLLITSDLPIGSPVQYFSAGASFDGTCPINTNCRLALPIYCDEPVQADISGTANAFDSPNACSGAGDGLNRGVWYSFKGNGEEVTAKIVSSGTNFDTQLAVYAGGNCDDYDSMTCIDGSDIVSNSGGEEITFTAFAGGNYRIYVDGWNGEQGSFELLIECSSEVEVDIQVLLEGCYAIGGLMNFDLGSLIPLSANAVYGGAPYNYSGTESLWALPWGMVDWVLVEARTGTPDPTNSSRGTTTVQTLAGILLNDGSITGTDGLPLRFSISPSTPHHFAVRHRNHLDVLSSAAFSGSFIEINFHTSVGAAFGVEQLKPSGDGFVYMHSGDYNQDHVIQTTDFDLWQADPAILNQYQLADGNLDGTVQTTDFDEWQKNKAKIGSIEVSY